MTAQVLYRKWRPKTYREIAGQSHVTKVLTQAVKKGRLSHAYLFCGPKGTGKTSTARVLARVLNCRDPQDGEPDNSCAMCQNLDKGRSLDLIEMDAASNRGIDEIRSIKEKIHFSPMEGKYKIYIVDEAHMLTEAASNAFLKTLEEPPTHVIFVLCTTEPHKILETITSRCQRLDFHRLSVEAIVERLDFLCGQENVEAQSETLQALARCSQGSMRDAENFLEQMVVSYGSPLRMDNLEELLGLGHTKGSKDLVGYLLLGNTRSALATIGSMCQEGADPRKLHRSAVELVRAILMIQSGATNVLDIDLETLNTLKTLSEKVTIDRVMHCLRALSNVGLIADSALPLGLELAVVESSLDDPYRHSSPTNVNPIKTTQEPQEVEEPPSEPPESQTPSPEDPSSSSLSAAVPQDTSNSSSTDDSAPVSGEMWRQVVQSLRRHKGKRFFLGALLRDCNTPSLENGSIILPFNHRSNMERMETELSEVDGRTAVEETLREFLGTPYKIKLTIVNIESGAGRPQSTDSILVKTARAMGGRVLRERRIDE